MHGDSPLISEKNEHSQYTHNDPEVREKSGWNVVNVAPDFIYCDVYLYIQGGSVAERLERVTNRHASDGGFGPHPWKSIFFLKYLIFFEFFLAKFGLFWLLRPAFRLLKVS